MTERAFADVLRCVADLVAFDPPSEIHFSDLATISSPASYSSRLCDHIRATQSGSDQAQQQLQTELRKAQTNGEAVRERLASEIEKSVALEANRAELMADLSTVRDEAASCRAKAQSGCLKILSSVAKLTIFDDPARFAFDDFDQLSSPDSYYSRLCDHIQKSYSSIEEESKRLQADIEKARSDGEALQSELSAERERCATLDAERARLTSELESTRSSAESASQQILAGISAAAGFVDSPAFSFDDFASVSSPDSYVTRLTAHIQQASASAGESMKKLQTDYQRLRAVATKLQADLKKSQSDGEALRAQLSTETEKSTALEAERTRLNSELNTDRRTAEAGALQILGLISKAASFTDTPVFSFDDFTTVSSHDSYAMRLAEFIQQASASADESTKKLRTDYQRLRTVAAKLQADLKKAQEDGEVLRGQLSTETSKCATLDSERSRLISELHSAQSTAEAASQQILAGIASAAGFPDSPTFSFSDFAAISSPDSFVSRLTGYIRQTNSSTSESLKKLQTEYQRIRGAAGKLQTDLKKSQADLASEMQKSAALDAELRSSRTIAESASQEILSSLAKAIDFSDSPAFSFADFTGFSSPDSFVARLTDHLRQTKADVIRLQADQAESQTKFEAVSKDHAQLTTQFAELQKRASVIPRLNKALTDLKAEHAKLTQQADALQQKANSLSSHEAEVASLMKSFVPTLPHYSPEHFPEYSTLFIKGFAQLLTTRAADRLSASLNRVNARLNTYARQYAQFSTKVTAVTTRCRHFRTRFLETSRAFQAISLSYSDSLSLIFPPSHRLTIQSPASQIHGQLAKVQALLHSLFLLLPKINIPLPDNLYSLALGLRRVLETNDIPQTLGDLTEDLSPAAITLPESPSLGLVPYLLSSCEDLGQMLNNAMPLSTVVEYLSDHLAVSPVPPATDAGFEALTNELKKQLRARDEMKSRFTKYADNVQSLLAGVAKSLPHTLDSLVETLRHPDI
jgi:predicted  nucleic acid-binding Zn-ribbon protein